MELPQALPVGLHLGKISDILKRGLVSGNPLLTVFLSDSTLSFPHLFWALPDGLEQRRIESNPQFFVPLTKVDP